MNVATIAIEEEKAQEYLAHYQEAVRAQRHTERLAEDQMMVRAFKAAAKGQELIHLTDSIRNAGVDHRGLPLLAIGRAHREWIYVEVERDGRVTFAEEPNPNWRARFSVRRLPAGTLPETATRIGWSSWTNGGWRAMVPTIPPHLRPNFRLGNYHILWEAEWVKHSVRAPKDPYLLKHIGGDLYAVLAAWDLTEVERAVMTGREE